MNFKKFFENAKAPERAGANEAGIDFFSAEEKMLLPGTITLINTGIGVEIPDGHVGVLKDRSSMGVKGLHVLGGVIDSTYRGEVKVIISNFTHQTYKIGLGDKITQMLVLQYRSETLNEVQNLSDSTRGTKGFGSTGA